MKLLSREGYRPFFAFFPLWGVLVLGLWGRSLSGAGPMGPDDHGAVMIWGVLGSAVLGFLLTAYPRQNEATPPGPRALAAALGLQLVAQASLLASWFGAPTARTASVAGALLWAGMLSWSLPIAVRSLRRRWDGTTAAVPVALAMALAGWVALRAGARGPGFGMGVWGFLVLLALALLDRLVPFFTGRVVPGYTGSRRAGFVPLLAPLLLLRAATGPSGALALLTLVVILRQWSGWRPDQARQVPMVLVLHLGVAWIALAVALDGLRGSAAGSLPTHLALAGGLGTLLFGLATRVTLGHGGLPVQADRGVFAVLALAQGAAIVRAALPALGWSGPWTLGLSAGLLAAAFAAWAARFVPIALREEA